MKKIKLNLFVLFALAGPVFLGNCSKDNTITPTAASFDDARTDTAITLYSNYATTVPTGLGSFYSSKTKTVGNSSNSTAADVDITYADVAMTGSAQDIPTFISPDSRSTFQIGETPTALGQQQGATATFFASTTLDYANATAEQVKAATAPTAKTITITQASNYIFQNAAGDRGIIKVTALPSVATSTTGQTTSNVVFAIKVVKK